VRKGTELEYAEATNTANVLLRYREFSTNQNQALLVGEYSGFWDGDAYRASEDAFLDDLIASGADLIAVWTFDPGLTDTNAGAIRASNDYTWVLDTVRETDANMRGEQPLSLSGVPVAWYELHGLSPTGSQTLAQIDAQDPDGDGFSNLQEYTQDTDPLVAALDRDEHGSLFLFR
jgi:hypothetical protein